ncbi:MAG TPA: TIM barrel protein, partial [Pirellulales bacterium]|nr:TIM barrel protein [Pirellulales bacterium]
LIGCCKGVSAGQPRLPWPLEGVLRVFVAASTECFPQLSFGDAVQRLVDLEYTRVEICLRESSEQLKPSQVHANVEKAVHLCRDTHRLTPVAYFVDIQAEGDEYYAQFLSCCKLAKASKVVIVSVPSAELGTPFNAEVERLRELVRIGTLEGVVVGIKTEVGRMSQDPDTAVVLCDNVKGLAISLDPSHYVCGPHGGGGYDQVMRHVCHVQLRDTSKTALQVRVGQGEIEYNRVINQLSRFKYSRALSVNIIEQADPTVDHMGEMRKMRLLLESML